MSHLNFNISLNLVSIIIPTYNRINFVIKAVESCLNQSYNAIEIIIIDDGSTDNTEEKVKELLITEWNNKAIYYYKQKNAGASAARNFGIHKAKGEYIQFLDSDDLLFKNKIEIQVNRIIETAADGCSCFGVMGQTLERADVILGENFDSVLDLMHKMCSGLVHVMQTMAPLWKKSVLLEAEGWNTNISFGDDLDYHIRVLSKVKKMCFIPETLFFLREHTGERLSVIGGNIKQIESGFATQYQVYKTLVAVNLWDKIFQNGNLKITKSLYANYLALANKNDIEIVEKNIIEIIKKPSININFIFLIIVRKIFGANFILFLFNLKKRIQK